jgi:hypothetical protein
MLTYEIIAAEVCSLNREELLQQLCAFEGPVKLDFTAEFLSSCSTDRIRHVLAAAIWHRDHRHGACMATAAPQHATA